jgi:hypothetical protein
LETLTPPPMCDLMPTRALVTGDSTAHPIADASITERRRLHGGTLSSPQLLLELKKEDEALRTFLDREAFLISWLLIASRL